MLAEPIRDCDACPLRPPSRGRCPLVRVERPPGAVLVHQGACAPALYLVRAGAALLSRSGAEGDAGPLGLRGPGALLCAEALRGARSDETVSALTGLSLCALAPEAATGAPARALLALVVDALLEERRAERWREGRALERVARFVAWCGGRRGPEALPLRQGQVARLLGLRPETLSRCLAQLARQGLLAPVPRRPVLRRAGSARRARGRCR